MDLQFTLTQSEDDLTMFRGLYNDVKKNIDKHIDDLDDNPYNLIDTMNKQDYKQSKANIKSAKKLDRKQEKAADKYKDMSDAEAIEAFNKLYATQKMAEEE